MWFRPARAGSRSVTIRATRFRKSSRLAAGGWRWAAGGGRRAGSPVSGLGMDGAQLGSRTSFARAHIGLTPGNTARAAVPLVPRCRRPVGALVHRRLERIQPSLDRGPGQRAPGRAWSAASAPDPAADQTPPSVPSRRWLTARSRAISSPLNSHARHHPPDFHVEMPGRTGRPLVNSPVRTTPPCRTAPAASPSSRPARRPPAGRGRSRPPRRGGRSAAAGRASCRAPRSARSCSSAR